MPPSPFSYDLPSDDPPSRLREDTIESRFIGSNRDRTYDAGNNNARHFAFNADTARRGSALEPREASLRSLSAAKDNRFPPVQEFAGEDNKKITHLDDFTDRFLKKCDLGRTICRYMVLIVSEQKLMIMRPYQVYAVQRKIMK